MIVHTKLAEKIREESASFFYLHGGEIVCTKAATVTTYSSPDKPIYCPNFYVAFNNSFLFGNGSFSAEVYPRYRKMRKDWREHLTYHDLSVFRDFAPGFVPTLKMDLETPSESYDKQMEVPLGASIKRIDEIASAYHQSLKQRYGVNYALVESQGMLIGPEGGMLRALETILKISPGTSSLVDVASGTGELSSLAMRYGKVKKLVVNELSLCLQKHLTDYLGKVAEDCKAQVDFQFGNCLEMTPPSLVDIFLVGVFYGLQPDLMKTKGQDIADCLGDEGVLVIQTSMPETLFNHLIIAGSSKDLESWPWYDPRFSVNFYFPYVETVYIDNEFVTFASRSRKKINDILFQLGKEARPHSEIYY